MLRAPSGGSETVAVKPGSGPLRIGGIVLVAAGGTSIVAGLWTVLLAGAALGNFSSVGSSGSESEPAGYVGLALLGGGVAAVAGGIAMILGAKTSVSQSVGGLASFAAPVAKARVGVDLRSEHVRLPPWPGAPIFTLSF
jgi:hypothetical protein